MDHSIIKLRTIAIVGVVLLHASAHLLLLPPTDTNWMLGNVLDGISRFCVPLFFMISGALLLGRNESLPVFFKKRAARIMIPFFIWSVFYYLSSNGFSLSTVDLKGFLVLLLEDNIFYHLWYFYLLIPIYLLIPLLQKVVQNMSTNALLGYSIFFIVLDNLVQFFSFYYDIFPQNYMTIIFAYISYLLIGYLIYHHGLFKNQSTITYLLGLLSIAVIIGGTYALSIEIGMYDSFFYRYTSIPVFIYTISIMIFISSIKKKATAMTVSIANHSFGIYLIHPFFMSYLNKLSFFDNAFLDVMMIFAGSFLFSYLSVLIINRIPFVRRVF